MLLTTALYCSCNVYKQEINVAIYKIGSLSLG